VSRTVPSTRFLPCYLLPAAVYGSDCAADYRPSLDARVKAVSVVATVLRLLSLWPRRHRPCEATLRVRFARGDVAVWLEVTRDPRGESRHADLVVWDGGRAMSTPSGLVRPRRRTSLPPCAAPGCGCSSGSPACLSARSVLFRCRGRVLFPFPVLWASRRRGCVQAIQVLARDNGSSTARVGRVASSSRLASPLVHPRPGREAVDGAPVSRSGFGASPRGRGNRSPCSHPTPSTLMLATRASDVG